MTGSDYALKHIVLPIGISFFTFQLIAFLVDAYRGETKEYDIINYLLFITFFPQLIVGPIIHHAEIVPQFEDEKNSVMLIGTYGNRRSCVRMGGPLQTDQMGLEVKHNGTVQIEGRQNRAVHH